jgi:RNA polymerase sigma-70 factor (ECF subfamily)
MLEPETTTARSEDADWLAAFHAGERGVLEGCYRDHFARVERSVGTVLSGADRETVIHEVFLRLLSNEKLRASFTGGSLGAWIGTVAHNHAIDFARRARREAPVAPEVVAQLADAAAPVARDVDGELLVEQFRRDVLPAKLASVFEARFLEQLSQREAAAKVGIRRTTLAYRELKIRSLLKRYLLGGPS